MSDFAIWVNATTSEGQRNFRPVVHIILDAIASTAKLRVDMVMKGGVLMDILYNTSRFTTDLDFSTTRHFRGGLVIYDIHYLLSHRGFPPEKKSLLLAELISKAQSRDLKIDQKSMRSDRVIERSRSQYGSLKDEIDGELPDFDRAFGVVRDFYESLPWAVSNASPS